MSIIEFVEQQHEAEQEAEQVLCDQFGVSVYAEALKLWHFFFCSEARCFYCANVFSCEEVAG
jgi:hypothetical protein